MFKQQLDGCCVGRQALLYSKWNMWRFLTGTADWTHLQENVLLKERAPGLLPSGLLVTADSPDSKHVSIHVGTSVQSWYFSVGNRKCRLIYEPAETWKLFLSPATLEGTAVMTRLCCHWFHLALWWTAEDMTMSFLPGCQAQMIEWWRSY